MDVMVNNHGSEVILNALTAAARGWVEEHLPCDRQTWGPNGTVVEPRYADAIIDGMLADGLVVGGDAWARFL